MVIKYCPDPSALIHLKSGQPARFRNSVNTECTLRPAIKLQLHMQSAMSSQPCHWWCHSQYSPLRCLSTSVHHSAHAVNEPRPSRTSCSFSTYCWMWISSRPRTHRRTSWIQLWWSGHDEPCECCPWLTDWHRLQSSQFSSWLWRDKYFTAHSQTYPNLTLTKLLFEVQ